MKNQLPAQFVSAHWDVIHSLVRLSQSINIKRSYPGNAISNYIQTAGRTIDMDQNASMEVKKQGYFRQCALYQTKLIIPNALAQDIKHLEKIRISRFCGLLPVGPWTMEIYLIGRLLYNSKVILKINRVSLRLIAKNLARKVKILILPYLLMD